MIRWCGTKRLVLRTILVRCLKMTRLLMNCLIIMSVCLILLRLVVKRRIVRNVINRIRRLAIFIVWVAVILVTVAVMLVVACYCFMLVVVMPMSMSLGRNRVMVRKFVLSRLIRMRGLVKVSLLVRRLRIWLILLLGKRLCRIIIVLCRIVLLVYWCRLIERLILILRNWVLLIRVKHRLFVTVRRRCRSSVPSNR